MNAITALKLAIESWNGISGEDESVSHECGFFAGKYAAPFHVSEVIEAITGPGEVVKIDDPETLAGIVGAIYEVSPEGFKRFHIHTDKSEFKADWRDICNEYGEWSYTVNSGHMVTIYDATGKDVAFLQDEDGAKLADDLADMNEDQVQETLRMYAD